MVDTHRLRPQSQATELADADATCDGCDRFLSSIPRDEDCSICPLRKAFLDAQAAFRHLGAYRVRAASNPQDMEDAMNEMYAQGFSVVQYMMGYEYTQENVDGWGGPIRDAVFRREADPARLTAAIEDRDRKQGIWLQAKAKFTPVDGEATA